MLDSSVTVPSGAMNAACSKRGDKESGFKQLNSKGGKKNVLKAGKTLGGSVVVIPTLEGMDHRNWFLFHCECG